MASKKKTTAARKKSPAHHGEHDSPTPAEPAPARPAAAGAAPAGPAPARAGLRAPQVTARLYCQGIGDCHLLKFRKNDGTDFHMLIDCGVHSSVTGGTAAINTIVDDIATVTRHLDVVVATHEHWDHISGFLTAAEKFRQFTYGEIWMAWTENPNDPKARALDKFKDQALSALQGATQRLAAATDLSDHLASVSMGLEPLTGFMFGAKGERVRSARDALVQLAPGKVRYLEPGNQPLTVPGLPNLRIYILGPPRDTSLFGITERASEMYGIGSDQAMAMAVALNSAFALDDASPSSEDWGLPFEPNVGADLALAVLGATADSPPDTRTPDGAMSAFLRENYVGPAKPAAKAGAPDRSWRRIDNDWLGASADLAMQLDSRTNNTSLVLGFEFIDTGRVMLFAADAQVGNWLSWQDLKWTLDQKTVTGPDLLARTVFYKVGHHGSHNATLKQKGLELMSSHDLSAFIPTNETDAKKVKWGQMPFAAILTELEQRTTGRVIRADDPWVATPRINTSFTPPSGSILGLRHQEKLFVEFDLG